MAVRKKFPKRKISVPKTCYFCAEKVEPKYSDIVPLQKFVSGQGKITPRSRNGICAKHQRRFTSAVKHARHLALLPFVGQ